MKRFLKSLGIFLLPVLLLFIGAEYLLRKIPNDYSLKESAYKKEGSSIETLVLGSSHAYYGLNPDYFHTRAFNGAHVGQTLDLDAAIFHKFLPRLTNLKYVILSVSDMSFFFQLASSEEDWRMKNYVIYYHLPATYRITDYFEILNLPFPINRTRLISYYWAKENPVTSTPLGFGSNYRSTDKQDLNISAQKALRVHKAKNSDHFAEEKEALENIIADCNKNDVKLILFTPPAYSTYSSRIDSLQFTTALTTCREFEKDSRNVYYYNFLNDASFIAGDYFDADHLNEIGAKKLSLKMDSILNRLGNNK